MAFEIKDLAGLSQPATKLIEVVSAAIGTLHRPRAIQAEAVAKAFELKTLGEAQAQVEETKKRIALEGALSRIEHIAGQNPELAARATQRLLLREVEGQENIESIVNHAMLALPPAASDQPVSPDWRRRFFIEAENVCDADMQFLWGRYLQARFPNPAVSASGHSMPSAIYLRAKPNCSERHAQSQCKMAGLRFQEMI